MSDLSLLHALGHELRWQLVTELSRSDFKVGELCTATHQEQNLVSYHLRLLRNARVVSERHSSADGRDVYYSLDRRAVSSGLAKVLTSIGQGPRPEASSKPHRPAGMRTSVLFLCTGNSARSQIAEAMLRQAGGRHVLVRSAGTRPAGVHPRVYDVLASRGIKAGHLRSKPLAEFAGQEFDFAISLCDIAREELPGLAGKPRLVHWSIPDPASEHRGAGAVARAFDQVSQEIAVRIQDLYSGLRSARPAA